MAQNLRAGVPMATPVFDGASEEDQGAVRMADVPDSGQLVLTTVNGRCVRSPRTVGYVHVETQPLVDEDARTINRSYSLVTQQPLGGKAQFGGQRFGEMEGGSKLTVPHTRCRRC